VSNEQTVVYTYIDPSSSSSSRDVVPGKSSRPTSSSLMNLASGVDRLSFLKNPMKSDGCPTLISQFAFIRPLEEREPANRFVELIPTNCRLTSYFFVQSFQIRRLN